MTTSARAAPGGVQPPVRVMVVDDSAVVRGLVSRWIGEAAGLELVGVATDGEQAVKRAAALQPEVCILDIEMPVMSGLEALPRLLAACPGLKVVMSSTLTTRGAGVTLRALDLGAADYIAKPDSTRLGGAQAFRDELVDKVAQLGGASRRRFAARPPTAPAPTPARPARPASRNYPRPDALVIGSSTGGPPALRALLPALGADWRIPILIVQHMPPTFTAILAEHLGKACGLDVAEAAHGAPVTAGMVRIAPGGKHMTVRRDGAGVITQLNEAPPENWCRPSVDPLFRSAADTWGDRVLGVILTGMGHDGRDGARALTARGALVMAQDEASSVVWGMPGALVEAGLAGVIAPVAGLAEAARGLVRGAQP